MAVTNRIKSISAREFVLGRAMTRLLQARGLKDAVAQDLLGASCIACVKDGTCLPSGTFMKENHWAAFFSRHPESRKVWKEDGVGDALTAHMNDAPYDYEKIAEMIRAEEAQAKALTEPLKDGRKVLYGKVLPQASQEALEDSLPPRRINGAQGELLRIRRDISKKGTAIGGSPYARALGFAFECVFDGAGMTNDKIAYFFDFSPHQVPALLKGLAIPSPKLLNVGLYIESMQALLSSSSRDYECLELIKDYAYFLPSAPKVDIEVSMSVFGEKLLAPQGEKNKRGRKPGPKGDFVRRTDPDAQLEAAHRERNAIPRTGFRNSPLASPFLPAKADETTVVRQAKSPATASEQGAAPKDSLPEWRNKVGRLIFECREEAGGFSPLPLDQTLEIETGLPTFTPEEYRKALVFAFKRTGRDINNMNDPVAQRARDLFKRFAELTNTPR